MAADCECTSGGACPGPAAATAEWALGTVATVAVGVVGDWSWMRGAVAVGAGGLLEEEEEEEVRVLAWCNCWADIDCGMPAKDCCMGPTSDTQTYISIVTHTAFTASSRNMQALLLYMQK